jgi:fructose-specific component phosphotransferase system IIB-like protein
MNSRSLAVLVAIAVLGTGIPAVAVAQHSHDSHSHAAHESPRLTLDAGRKWATDAPLRRAMEDIQSALYQQRQAILERNLGEAQSKALGQLIEARVATIVAECKLEPRADANLHIVVADLVEAADVLQGKSRQKPFRGAAKAVRAAQMYATYFDHPGWRPVYGDEAGALASADSRKR